ncbi:FUSC family protein [Rhodococcus coprophilus]|uniref:FUSC family protein n=1 Tax=Rhodococcus coprophilus TaxID=38310 RepID=UPI000A7383AB|nr:putative membrane protein YccC [Rhodococcus coprophilus]
MLTRRTSDLDVASIFITAMALLLNGIGESLGVDIALGRVGDTLIGVVVGVRSPR